MTRPSQRLHAHTHTTQKSRVSELRELLIVFLLFFFFLATGVKSFFFFFLENQFVDVAGGDGRLPPSPPPCAEGREGRMQ